MPGIVVFGRRWSVGSDDLVVPALILVFVHVIWLTTLVLIFGNVEFDLTLECSRELRDVVLGYIVILLVCIIVESVVTLVSIRGSILDVDPRASMQYLMYIRIVVGLGELSWLVVGIRWLARFFGCLPNHAGQAVLGMSVFNSFMILLGVLSVWCTFDSAGRKWVKFKRYQESMKSTTHRSRRSGGSRRNWRQRKAMRAYEESWDRRLGLMCCCVERKGRNKNSMSEIAQLFTEFFRDLDVVPSDVIAGLVLLRRFQRMRMQYTINQDVNDVYQYLSGVAVTPRSQFLQLGQPEVMQQYKIVIHYMKFAMAAYGWPLFVMMNTGTGLCRMMPYLRCCCCHRKCCSKGDYSDYDLEDNCCECNVVALKKISGTTDMDLVYVSYHVDIGETPFYVALDKKHKKIVICVRGTLSLQDVLTDLKADAEVLPLDPVKEDWVAHKGMVQAAIYIKKKLKDDLILAKAFQKAKEQSDERYDLVLVGHSLGAGTAAILAILLHQEYQDLQCYAYSPPGGLLSKECMEATKTFITSVVIAKDIVPRIGLPQMELLRTDLINIIKKSKNPKWKIIMKALCCGTGSAAQFSYDDVKEDLERNVTKHPSDDQIGLTAHKAMFPPGKIILVVRKHSGGKEGCCGEEETVYQAIWADNSDFQEVLISPTMVNDHMPDNVLEALEKVLVNVAPPKPTRLLTEPERTAMLKHDMSPGTPETPLTQLPAPIVNQHTVHVVSEKGTSEAENLIEYYLNSNNIGWDAATEELLLSLDRQHLFPGLGDNARLEMLDMESELIQAPLASPEGLSAASSMITLNRVGSLQKHEAKSESISLRLEPIEQSPEICVRTDESFDSTNALDALKPQIMSGLTMKRMSLNESVSVCDFMKKGHLLGALQLDSIAHASQGSLNNLLPNVDYESSTEALYKDNTSLNDNGSNSGIEMNPGEEQIMDTTEGKTNLTGQDVSENCIPADQTSEFMKVKNDNNNYERHSPIENTQYGYFDPNEVYSAASLGYRPPQIAVSEFKPSVRLYSPDSPKSSHPPNKVLQYSMSESRLKGLSDEYKMRRSTEEGDIAHLEDATTVFVHDDARKLLKTRDTEPAFDLNLLPKNFSDCRLYSVKESEDNEGETNRIEESKVNSNADNGNTEKVQNAGNEEQCQYPTNIGSNQQAEIWDKTNIDTGNDAVDERTCLLERKESDDDKTVTEENRPSSENSVRNEITNLGRVSTLSSPDDADRRLFHSNSCHSTFASSTSGESEQRLSLISANSEDFPIVETDV